MLWVLFKNAHRGTSNEYPDRIFCGEIQKNRNLYFYPLSCWTWMYCTLPLQTVYIQISWLLNWIIQYVNLYQQSGSSNLICWKLEMGVASIFIQHDKG